MIKNKNYQGPWKPDRIPNPEYKGPFMPKQIPNPRYRPNPDLYIYEDFGYVGFDLWQVGRFENCWQVEGGTF